MNQDPSAVYLSVPFEGNTRVVEGIIFDGDGVLFNSEELTLDGFRQLLSGHGLQLTREDCEPWIGLGTRELLIDLAQRRGLHIEPDVYTSERDRIYREICLQRGGPEPMAEVLALLEWLDRKAFPMAVASGASPEKLGFNLERTALGSRFAVAVSSHEVPLGKPAPDVYIEAARRIGVRAADTIIVEDTLVGLRGARAAGAVPVGICGTYTKAELERESSLVFQDHRQFLEWLRSLEELTTNQS